MSRRLLLDENLSERLVAALGEGFDAVSHVRIEGLGGASDAQIWARALQSGATLVTKDEDFLRLSIDLGWPPKVICLAIGNASNAKTAAFLLANVATMRAFIDQQESGFLLLQPRP